MDLAELRALDRGGLEALYRGSVVGPTPSGWHRGVVLCRLERRPLLRAVDTVLFHWIPFGVDFTARVWTFFGPRGLRAGRFRATRRRSRWRDTETLALEYDESRLPPRVRSFLYDEVKPLVPGICLGIGGINAATGAGEQFFFALAAPNLAR